MRCKGFLPTPSAPLNEIMSRHAKHRPIPESHRGSEHLDNERTFLAWVRTDVALISLGFVVSRLSPTLSAAGAVNASRILSKTQPVGIVLIVFGALVTVLAALRYDQVNRQIEAGMVKTDRGLVWIVTLLIFLLSAAAVVYMVMGG
jgi:putative membrane protein